MAVCHFRWGGHTTWLFCAPQGGMGQGEKQGTEQGMEHLGCAAAPFQAKSLKPFWARGHVLLSLSGPKWPPPPPYPPMKAPFSHGAPNALVSGIRFVVFVVSSYAYRQRSWGPRCKPQADYKLHEEEKGNCILYVCSIPVKQERQIITSM